MSDSPILQAVDLHKTYPEGDVRAVVGVTLDVAAGEYVAVMGPSGSGKSTLLNLLGGLDTPDSGEVRYRGGPLGTGRALDRYRADEVGFVFQAFHLMPTLTALENVQIPMFEGPLRPRQRAERAAGLLDLVGMSHRAKHLPTRLSVGEKQRVAIARSLANGPALILADEPTGNLDSATADDILDLFDSLHRDQEKTLVIVTHSREVGTRAERLVQYRDGKLQEDAVPAAVG